MLRGSGLNSSGGVDTEDPQLGFSVSFTLILISYNLITAYVSVLFLHLQATFRLSTFCTCLRSFLTHEFVTGDFLSMFESFFLDDKMLNESFFSFITLFSLFNGDILSPHFSIIVIQERGEKKREEKYSLQNSQML